MPPDVTDQARALLDDLLLSNDGLSGQEQIIVAALSAAREAGKAEALADLPKCPKCGTGVNSAEAGGNVRCFHCGSCDYIDCADGIDTATLLAKARAEGKAEGDRAGYQRGLRRAADLARFMARCEDGTFSDLAEALEREAESR